MTLLGVEIDGTGTRGAGLIGMWSKEKSKGQISGLEVGK